MAVLNLALLIEGIVLDGCSTGRGPAGRLHRHVIKEMASEARPQTVIECRRRVAGKGSAWT